MFAVEFEADVHDGKVEILAKYRKQLGKHIKLIALVDERNIENTNGKSTTYANMMELNDLLGGDDLVEAVLKGMPEDFTYVQSFQSDSDIWFEERKHKYECIG